MRACRATLIEPNLISNYWHWEVSIDSKALKGKAATEPEAWRLIRDAEKYLERKQNELGIII